MFIATMFSYGNDVQAVGVDGINGCMGIFLATAARLYAIHIPDQPQHFTTARNAFVGHVNGIEPGFNRGTARLYAAINGNARPGAYRELLDYALALGGVRKMMTVRVNGFGANAATIILERIPQSTDCRLKVHRNDQVNWQHGAGTVRSGFYHNGSMNQVLSTVTALASGWRLVDSGNSNIATTNW